MSRLARRSVGGLVYHALNRGNGRAEIFHKPGDFDAFLRIIAEAKRVVPTMRLLAYCLMPNHWHLVLWPQGDGDLSRFVGWLSNTHVKRYRQHYPDGTGHLYQGRFRSFPVECGGVVGPLAPNDPDRHFLVLCHYVEANALRAGLVARAGDWPWSSFAALARGDPLGLLSDWPVERPADWAALLEEVLPASDAAALRHCVSRGRPLGNESWARQAAAALGLSPSVRPRGRPRKIAPPAGLIG